ncbi:F-box/kelch-repeat protein At3g23880-like [Vicia villosa]|uniref:F-box/kelch-repeat protein At3g23880-like n=1 Tax=Vicia villosa TaxID=3911 RepID=UPI00273C50B1|nr:F-box/kelch-repeat protein At3g23880-like [Vicia villosa]XP_058754676.1 F-box/kelch-repeat protein At3g23880-like [Vicia villosa]
MSSSSALFISNDLIAEVLSLLKVKSVVRFRCVSKNWDTLISDPTFVKLHLKKSAKLNPHFLLITEHRTFIPGESPYGSDDECEYECCVIPYSISSLLENPSFALSVDSYDMVQHKECSKTIGSCNGLVCLSGESIIRADKECWFRLWNPATRTTSPKFGFLRYYPANGRFDFTFGYDKSTGNYKIFASRYIMRERRSEVRILCLGDDVWRDIQTFPVEPLYYSHTGVSFKSTFNWLAIHNTTSYNLDTYKDITIDQFLIVSFDLSTETYNQYLLPPEFDEVPPNAPNIGVLGDCLSFSYCSKETHFIIWQMKKFGVQDSWSQFLKIGYHNLQIEYDYSHEYLKFHFELVPLFLSKDGDTLVLKESPRYKEFLYNWRNGQVVRTKITASKTTTTTTGETSNLVLCSANGYFESLVSVFGVIRRITET